jgi:membrane protein DedA with SNARE-associated domain
MHQLHWLFNATSHYATILPLELIAFILAFVEEIIPPIPALPMMVTLGLLARNGDYILAGLVFIALFSAAGKTLGAYVVYRVTDKLEDVFVERYGKYFGIKPGQIESFGTKLSNGWTDYLVLITLRATPLVSSTLISVGGGLIKIPLRLFLISTYIGSIIRDTIYLYIGYSGVRTFRKFMKEADSISETIILVVLISITLYLVYRFYKYKTKSPRMLPPASQPADKE